jgi:hypothetical protein
MGRRKKANKRSGAKTILRLPDLEQSKNAVLNSLAAASSQESYAHAIDEFIGWLVLFRAAPGLQSYRCPSLSILSRTEEPGAVPHQRAVSSSEKTRIRGGRYWSPESRIGSWNRSSYYSEHLIGDTFQWAAYWTWRSRK